MRFGIPDPDDEDYVVDLDLSYSSDESDHVPDFNRQRYSKLGESIRDMLALSDSSGDEESEDEVLDLIGGSYLVPSNKSWRSPQKGKGRARDEPPPSERSRSVSLNTSNTKSFNGSTSKSRHASSSKRAGPSWRRWEPSMRELLREEPNEYNDWVKDTEAEAWRDGHRVAGERRARLRQIEDNVRAEIQAAQKGRRQTEVDELQRFMAGLSVQQRKEEEDTTKRFAEREAKLWADVDAAIKDAERRVAEEQAARAAEALKLKQEEEARIATAEKEALARKAEAERAAKEKADQEASDKAEREKSEAAAKAQEEAAKAEEDKRLAAQAEGSRNVTEWENWVKVQKRMKVEVIEPVKANRDVRSGLRMSMRLITRGLGQVVNTKQDILRVTNEIEKILVSQLPSAPSASQPVTFEGQIPPAYGYIVSHLSKALIRQAESEVSAKPDAAFPLARIVLGLMLRGHAAVATIFFARLVKKCPWVVPHLPCSRLGEWSNLFAPTDVQNQSREEYEKSTGRGSDESIADYIARMAGISTLYFAVVQTSLSSIVQTLPANPTPQQLTTLVPAPFRLPAAWTWLAAMQRPPLPGLPPSAHLYAVAIDTVGHALLAVVHPKQLDKLLMSIKSGLEGGKIPGDSPAAKVRLELLLDGWQKKHTLNPPKHRDWE